MRLDQLTRQRDAEPLPPQPAPRMFSRARLRSLLWHRPRPDDGRHLDEARKLRSAPDQQAVMMRTSKKRMACIV